MIEPKKSTKQIIKGEYFRLVDTQSEAGKSKAFLEANNNHNHGYYFEVSAEQFEKIPGSPIAYWLSTQMFNVFCSNKNISMVGITKKGIIPGNAEVFLRLWFEVNNENIGYHITSYEKMKQSNFKWFPCMKGGKYKKWYGNQNYLIDMYNDSYSIKYSGKNNNYSLGNSNFYFKKGITWTDISSSSFAARYTPEGFLSDSAGPMVYINNDSDLFFSLSLLNSKCAERIFDVISACLHFSVEHIASFPLIQPCDYVKKEIISICVNNIKRSRSDWDSFETSWDFVRHPLLEDRGRGLISECYERYKEKTNEAFFKLKENEEELNRIFIDIYGLQDELKPEEDDSMVSVHRIFDSDSDIPQSMRKGNYALTKKDVVKSFISYAVACMFGRYSLDSDGLAFAGGDWDSSKYKSFIPDEDNVITVLSSEWFADDIVSRFREFVKACFGQENLSLNMRFIEDALGTTVRGYFLKSFYEDHVRTYQKRPIYWMFSSPKGYFNALIYLHRYNENTPSIVLRYLRQFRSKISSEISVLQEDKNNERQVQEYKRILDDLDSYEQILYPIAMNNIQLDLDDGVKVNYLKLGNALRKVPGLEKKE